MDASEVANDFNYDVSSIEKIDELLNKFTKDEVCHDFCSHIITINIFQYTNTKKYIYFPINN